MNPSRLLPLPEEVLLHHFDLDREAAGNAAFWEILSEDERLRANRYQFPKDRDRFVAGRGLLRRLLAEYLGDDPAAVRFRYEPNGKPHLAGNTNLQFNLAHSDSQALVAVTNGCAVGVDIEKVRTDLPLEAMARGVFSPKEQEWLLSLASEEARCEYFFILWVLKEAFVKCIGEGLSYPLQEFTITPMPDDSAVLEFEKENRGGWALRRVPVETGYHAAVVLQTIGAIRELR